MMNLISQGGTAGAILILALVIAIGLWLGRFKVWGISFGMVWILFVGIILSHFGLRINPTMLSFIKDFGLILFVFAIGLQVGPGFFSSFRKEGLPMNLMAVFMVVLTMVTTYVIHLVSGENLATMTGVMSGAITNTPGMGAAQQALTDSAVALGSSLKAAEEESSTIASAYAVAYPIGVLGAMLLVMCLKGLFRIDIEKEKAISEHKGDEENNVLRIACKVENPAIFGKRLASISEEKMGEHFVVSRVMRGSEVSVADPDWILAEGAKNVVSAKEANATAAPKVTNKPTAKVTNTPRPTATPDLSRDIYLESGSSGRKVETLQRRLIELGWMSGSVTGKYDAATEAAVSAFQKKAKLWVDGKAGPDTLNALYSANAPKGSNPVSSKMETLEMGSEGNDVKQLQQKLKDLGYLSGSADGKFGKATEAAVITFQKNNGLTADGKAGTATLNKLYSGTAKKFTGTQAKLDDNNSSGRDTSNISSTGYITLESGSSGEQVKTLQNRLKDLGYYHGNVDGNFGEGTETAVMAFQQNNNLTVDGKAGPATQRVLYGSKTNITYASMRQGDEGNAVKNLQYTLYELGYYDGAIDGKYGQTTADAVRAFQIQNKITPVDGVAGSKTLGKMYSSDAVAATVANVSYDTVQAGDKGEMD